MSGTPIHADAEGHYRVAVKSGNPRAIDTTGMGGSLWSRYRRIRKGNAYRKIPRGLALRVALHHWLENPPRKPLSRAERKELKLQREVELVVRRLDGIRDQLTAIQNQEAKETR